MSFSRNFWPALVSSRCSLASCIAVIVTSPLTPSWESFPLLWDPLFPESHVIFFLKLTGKESFTAASWERMQGNYFGFGFFFKVFLVSFFFKEIPCFLFIKEGDGCRLTMCFQVPGLGTCPITSHSMALLQKGETRNQGSTGRRHSPPFSLSHRKVCLGDLPLPQSQSTNTNVVLSVKKHRLFVIQALWVLA